MAPAAPDVVDAARVQLLREVTDSHRATPPEDFAGAQAHETAVGKAMDQLAAGQRVTVDNLPDAAGAQVSQALADRMAGCVGVIGVDSGLSHVAVALDLPHVQIYNFDTAWRTGPLENGRQVSVFAAPHPEVDAVWQAWESLATPVLCQ